jgi:ankyrin repeat protein
LTKHVRTLLAYGADPNAVSSKDLTVGYYAIILADNPIFLEILLQNGMHPDSRIGSAPDALTLLAHSIKENKIKHVQLLLNYKADPCIPKNNPTHSALSYAMGKEDLSYIEMLLKNNFDPNLRVLGNPLIYHTIRQKRIDLTGIFLDYGADRNAIDANNDHVAFQALLSDDPIFLELLLKHVLNPNAKISNSPDALTLLAYAVKHHKMKHVQLLLQYKADPLMPKDNLNNSALCYAFCQKDSKYAQELLKAQLNPNLRILVRDGRSFPLLYSTMLKKQVVLTRLLLDHGADANATTNDGEPIVALALNFDPIFLKTFIDANVNLDITAKDIDGIEKPLLSLKILADKPEHQKLIIEALAEQQKQKTTSCVIS